MTSTDRRVRRSQGALQRALIELVLEKGFEATSVAEIAERANVGRSTFYTHYADKEDLLQGSIDGLRQHLRAHGEALPLPSAGSVHPALAFCLPMLEHAAENRELFHAMANRPSGNLVMELFHDMWTELVRRGWPEADDVAVQTIVGGFGSTISWWLSSAPELTPREVFERFVAIVEPGLP